MEPPIAFLIERTSFASSYGDVCLDAAGGYSIGLKFWWHFKFLVEVVLRTLKHLPDNNNGRLISINILECVVVIIDYCAALTVIITEDVTYDPHPILLNIADNMYISTFLDNACLQIFKAGKVVGEISLLSVNRSTLGNKFQMD